MLINKNIVLIIYINDPEKIIFDPIILILVQNITIKALLNITLICVEYHQLIPIKYTPVAYQMPVV